MTSEKIGIIILAAGGSTRLGEPKQLLEFRGKTLLRRAVDTALAAECGNAIVVLGAAPAGMIAGMDGLPVHWVVNDDWPAGMSTSIKSGLTKLTDLAPAAMAAIFMLCDQPLVTVDTIKSLIVAHHTTGRNIAACGYEGSVGVPALFGRGLFDELMQLDGDRGAKSIILKYAGEATIVDAPEAACDIDDPQDYQSLIADLN